MHIEIQVALNFVISYLYNKLPRRRVNIFGEELEKAFRDKFQGHWYPEKPFKGSAYRCLKTGDPIDAVLARAARESGVPISDILENLPNELSVWVDPGEVSYRIGEKGAVKILYTENNENHEDSHSADREVTKTFNPEAQCFRPIDAVNTTMNNLSLSPKALPLASLGTSLPPAGSSPHSAASNNCSPTYKGSPNPNGSGSSGGSIAASTNNAAATATAAAFVQRAAQAPLTFTTATFAQTKFGSTKLKTSSKRTNSSSYRMSPTEFSNYIKQRAMQQQLHHGHGSTAAAAAFGGLDAVSPARSLSPNPLTLGGAAAGSQSNASTAPNNAGDPFYYPNMAMGLYPQYNGQRNLYEPHFNADAGNLGLIAGGGNSFSTYLEPCYYANQQQQQQQQQQQLEHANSSESCFGLDTECSMANAVNEDSINPGESSADSSPIATPTAAGVANILNAVPAAVSTPSSTSSSSGSNNSAAAAASAASTTATATTTTAAAATATANNQQDTAAAAASNNKLIDGLSSFYGSGSTYQQLLVAN